MEKEGIRQNKYSTSKDTGIEWLGRIPSHWILKKVKYLWDEKKSLAMTEGDTLLSVSQYRGVCINKEESRGNSQIGYNKVNENDLVINIMLAWLGGLGLSAFSGVVSPSYAVYELTYNANTKFLHYLYRTKIYLAEFARKSTGVVPSRWRMYSDDFGQVLTVLPPVKEQTAIANFLDKKTAKIDQAIAQKERLIELLKERKQIVIQNAVTKGLDPDVEMKDSGVEWIGEIPAHWDVKRFRNLFRLSKGLTITKDDLQNEGIPCINYGEIHSKYAFEVNPEIHSLKCVDKKYLKEYSSSLIGNGDFVFADTSEDLEGSGNFTYLNYDGIVFAGYHTIIAKPRRKINSRFLAYELDSSSFRNQVRTKMKGVKVYSITQSILKELVCWTPTILEQNKIVNYLDAKCSKIYQAISIQKTQIDKLKEYKTTLIDSAVTGKLRVPSVQEIKRSEI